MMGGATPALPPSSGALLTYEGVAALTGVAVGHTLSVGLLPLSHHASCLFSLSPVPGK